MAFSPTYCSSCGTANRAGSAFCHHCGSSLTGGGPSLGPTGRLASGQLLQQRYHILHVVGQGGMGAIYKAEDTLFGNRLVAVKEMRQTGLDPQEIAETAEQFKQEALLLAGLKHPSLPSIYDHFAANGRWYLVMDFIEGETLEEHLNRAKGKVLPLPEVLDIGIQLSKVLGYLHTRPTPIIFRDLKPSNVMLTPDGNVYLIDFGIARLFKPGQAKDTVAYGSAGYASREQYGKAQTTPQSDIYSLGVMLHEMLSGNDPSAAPFQFAPLHIPEQPELAALITQMLDMDVSKRPPSMAAVRQALERIADQQRHPPVPPTTPASSPSPTVTPLNQTVVTPPPPKKRHGKLIAMVALLLIIGLAVLANLPSPSPSNDHSQVTRITSSQPTSNNTAATATTVGTADAAIIAANPDPYQPSGTLALLDALDQPYAWKAGSNINWGGQCQFVNGMYEIHQLPPKKFFKCSNNGPQGGQIYNDFAFEVKMTISQGDCGGLTIRGSRDGSEYFFEVCQNGLYRLVKYMPNSNSTTLTGEFRSSPVINQGTGQSNVVAVVAHGNTLDLYVNSQNIDSVSDDAYSQGSIGLTAGASSNETTVTYQDVRVWRI